MTKPDKLTIAPNSIKIKRPSDDRLTWKDNLGGLAFGLILVALLVCGMVAGR